MSLNDNKEYKKKCSKNYIFNEKPILMWQHNSDMSNVYIVAGNAWV